ncbi:MAG: hydrogenase [Candidatus Omnitrophica bacterium CG12_big_fil_rev_8_21_14_0_65_45_16]|nr:MAG: hydrogenase [Candidatus Omnitrophica bacterium CG22_combo_CG10-13_8_21_14_all_43_16]PIW64915.1 MAG: hydrogenase [Candidatus Omnitrophica bacterium CG12_big_fil_rev_8_21_14_0_65_45_16]PJC47694.1 MAG: hydrogenase [Candidatus Omnitrophica bacterium CG_4_9_14_0_2_um_filter_42_8]
MIHILKNRILKGVVTKHIQLGLPKEIETTGLELKSLIQKRFGRSLHIREVDTGSCGACESEIISANNPIYDLQRFGISFVASPRHADALLVTGAVSKNMLTALKRTYEAMPEPKFVVTCGDCALDGGLFKGSYYVEGAVKDILPVALHIPGCPPSPLSIIQTLLEFLRRGAF